MLPLIPLIAALIGHSAGRGSTAVRLIFGFIGDSAGADAVVAGDTSLCARRGQYQPDANRLWSVGIAAVAVGIRLACCDVLVGGGPGTAIGSRPDLRHDGRMYYGY